jgi:hypothetical protein
MTGHREVNYILESYLVTSEGAEAAPVAYWKDGHD